MTHVRGAQREEVKKATARLKERLNEMGKQVAGAAGLYVAPPAVAEVLAQITMIERGISKSEQDNTAFWLPDELLPLAVAAVRDWRHEKALRIEEVQSILEDRSVVQPLYDEFAAVERLTYEPWFKATEPMPIPRLSDITTLEIAESVARHKRDSAPRVYDEKFRTLQAPQQLFPDLRYWREACGMRGRSVGLAFVDIDGFKAMNTKYGEPTVDERLLPPLMRTIEAFAFARGHAYRQGGDEYVLALPNVAGPELRSLLEQLRGEVAQLKYRRPVVEVLTASIGYVVLAPNSTLTEREALDKAADAMHVAKDSGKDAVRGFDGEPYDDPR